MFRPLLHPILRSLMAVLAAGALAEPASAVANVTDVVFTVTVAKTSTGPDAVTAEIRVKGTGLNSGSITIPGALGLQTFATDGADLAVGFLFANEAQMNTLFPAGSYALSINNGNVAATIAYDARPAVPSPAISQPEADAVLAPGPVQVKFTACPICNLPGDSVVGQLEEGVNVVANETLTENDNSWIPPDGVGGDLALGENSQFTAMITHTAVRAKNVAATGDDTSFAFTSTFIQSDAVAFATGFNPPSGSFCIVVNSPTPPSACAALNDPLLGILDSSGPVASLVDGHAVQCDLTLGSGGTITGSATADLDDDTIFETSGPMQGRLAGKAGMARQKLSFLLENPGLGAKLKVGVSDELSIPGDSLARVQKASGVLGGMKVSEQSESNQTPLPMAAQGWRLDFTLGAGGVFESALLTLDGGRSFPLQGSNRFKLASNVSSLKLQSADKGISIQLRKVGLDGATNAVSGGDLGYKILGQSGKVSLP